MEWAFGHRSMVVNFAGPVTAKTARWICRARRVHHRGSAEEKARAMRRRSPLVQAAATGAVLALALPLAVRAEGSADRASRTLNFGVRRDRPREGARGARRRQGAVHPRAGRLPRRPADRRGPR